MKKKGGFTVNRKRILFILPSIALPYVVLLALALLLLSTRSSLCALIMQMVFNNGLYLLLAALGYGMIAFLLNAVGFIISLCKQWDALSLAKSA